MKKMIAALSAGLMLATSCGEPENEISVKAQQPEEMQSKTVTFTFGEDRGGTRATLQELNITDLWLFDYVGDELKQTIHKTEGFDALTLSMDYSEHRLCFVASRGADPTVTAPNISWEKPSDTFWATLTMDVQPATSATQSVTLKRVATRLRIGITDEITAQMVRLDVEPATWYYGIDVKTGEGTDVRRQMRSVTIPASYIGTQGQLTASFFGLSPASDRQTDIDVRLIGSSDALLGEVLLPSVSFRQNRATTYGGGILGRTLPMSVSVDDTWLPDEELTW
jgi:predicted outer membrane repeat protein